MRGRIWNLVAVAALTAAVGGLLAQAAAPPGDEPHISRPPVAGGGGAAVPTNPQRPPGPRTLAARPVSVRVDGFHSWALLDRTTGRITGSPNMTATSSTESIIKIWIVADHLRGYAVRGVPPSRLALRLARAAIRDSDNNATQVLYEAGNGAAGIRRMISTCRLTETRIHPSRWSRTRISARDAVRLGECVADGRAAGRWTGWVLREMANVRGSTAPSDQRADRGGGRWGIIDGLPKEIVARGVGIKNGWTAVGGTGRWHVNCLAVADDWVLAVLTRYPAKRGLRYGADTCRRVAAQLVVRHADEAAG